MQATPKSATQEERAGIGERIVFIAGRRQKGTSVYEPKLEGFREVNGVTQKPATGRRQTVNSSGREDVLLENRRRQGQSIGPHG
jgi:hypothetical protein